MSIKFELIRKMKKQKVDEMNLKSSLDPICMHF